ncbi:MAG: V-type ATP synthase subunit I [Candidatus Aminicenantaceae bacterium]
MAIAEVQKVKILTSIEKEEEFLSSLQNEGLIEIEKTDTSELGLKTPEPDTSQYDHTIYRLSHALNYLSEWEEKSFSEKLLSEKPRLSRHDKKEALEFDYLGVIENVEKLESKKNEALSHLNFLKREKEFLDTLKNLEIPVMLTGTRGGVEVIPGVLPLSRFEEFQKFVSESSLWYSLIEKGKRKIYVLVIYLKKEEDIMFQAFKDLNFNPLYFTDSIWDKADDHDRVKDVIRKVDKEIEKSESLIDTVNEGIKNLASNIKELKIVHDVLINERKRLVSLRELGQTEKIFYIEGWIRAKDREKLKSKLKAYEDVSEVYFRDPLAEENPPVILENPKPTRPFEMITKLYGLPKQGTVDPTIPLAPFFFIFVGLTVSEAGYGFLVGFLSILYIKFGKPKGALLQFMQLLLFLSVANVILGTLVGGWFGFPLRKLMVIDPVEDPLSFLILSLVLGFIQVWVGTLIRMISLIKNREYLQAIFVQGGWLLLLPSLVVYGYFKVPLGGILSLIGAAAIIFFAVPKRNPFARFFGGLYSLYDISRYLADILSYSRLLALGLATSVIAMVVNTLCKTALGIPWVGWLFAALIFTGGHLFNLGISFLGGFVHSMRLQFVEFFSKFFISGGRPFKPFELESKYIEFI